MGFALAWRSLQGFPTDPHARRRNVLRGKLNRTFHAAWIWAFISLAAIAFAPGVATASEVVRIKSKTANVRSGPGTRFKKVWTAPQNYPYRVIKRKGRWLKVRDYEGYKDWVHKGLTDGKHAVIVKVKSANIRKGPSTDQPAIFTADKGVPFLVVGKKGSWLKVRHADGDEGWIARKLLWGASRDPSNL